MKDNKYIYVLHAEGEGKKKIFLVMTRYKRKTKKIKLTEREANIAICKSQKAK